MAVRILVFLLLVGGLVAALVYSQHRPVPQKVSGFLEVHDIRVGSRVGGRIAKVAVVEGQRVKKGDLLVELEAYDLESRLAEARGRLDQAIENAKKLAAGFRKEEIAQAQAKRDQLKAQYEKARIGPRPQEIAEAQALFDSAVVQQNISEANYQRVSRLFKINNATPDERDRAENDFKAAVASLAVRRERLDLLKEGTRKEDIDTAAAQLAEAEAALELMKNGSRPEDIAAANAMVASAQGAIDIIEKQREELKIFAPVDGTVDAVDIRPGDLLAANAPALSILEAGELWVRAYVPENRLNLQIGQKVRVTVDSFPARDFHGTITFVSRQAEPTPGNVQTIEERSKQVFRIRVEMDDGKDVLRAGMTADVWL
ncbi:MAG: efflux RND transporter periplasmic adaptor subunit [Phycisphaerales bacterium]|nr:efflux RND transporter periplasmic adaptor subunit [Phycisphaerales bacterium]